MENKAYSELKKRALLAKQRLKLGYWEQLRSEREQMLQQTGETDSARQMVSRLQRAKLSREMDEDVGSQSAEKEEKLYLRVCEILEEDEDVMNPIGRLMDKDEYESLDDGGRARYVLELSKKFIELKERYYQERLGKSG